MLPRRLRCVVLLIVLQTATASLAGEAEALLVPMSAEVSYAVPSDSPVQYLGPGSSSTGARFLGRFTLEGSYRYGYVIRDASHQETLRELELAFLPDEAMRKRLPYWQQRGAVREIHFRNPGDFVDAVIPRELIQQLRERNRYSVSGRVTIRVQAFEASVECDAPRYLVDFLSSTGTASAFTGDTLLDPPPC